MRFTFSLLRSLVAAAMFCGAFAFMYYIGAPGLFAPCLLGGSLAGLALIVKDEDTAEILRTICFCFIGGSIPFSIAIAQLNPPSPLPYLVTMVCVFLGALFGEEAYIIWQIKRKWEEAERMNDDSYDDPSEIDAGTPN